MRKKAYICIFQHYDNFEDEFIYLDKKKAERRRKYLVKKEMKNWWDKGKKDDTNVWWVAHKEYANSWYVKECILK